MKCRLLSSLHNCSIITSLNNRYYFYSIFKGPKAPQNPWESTTLEWTTPVEHIHGNWPGEIPTVHRWAYDYSKPGFEEDFIPQTVPLREGEDGDGH